MNFRNSVKIHVTEYTRKSPEILVFKPACCAVTVNLNRKLVVFFLEIRSNTEFGRCKAVLGVTYKLAVKPHIDCGFDALKADVCIFADKSLVNIKEFHIASHRVSLLRYLRRKEFFLAFPWILCVHILWFIVSL